MIPREDKILVIMFTDIVGFSTVMSQDEEEGFRMLDLNREIHHKLIEEFGGHLVKEFGDGFLITFESNRNAISCALEIFKKVLENDKYHLRIALHTGEVAIQEGDIVGDGVNIAARIEEITPADTIYISESVYEGIRNHPEIKARKVGKIRLRNIGSSTAIFGIEADFLPKPTTAQFEKQKTRLYRSRSSLVWIIPLAVVVMIVAGFLYFINRSPDVRREEVSIAIIPFENMAGDSSIQYFCMGVTLDLLVELDKIENLRIVDRYNVRNFQSLNKTHVELAEELGVSNLLIGSIRRSNDRVRVSARLLAMPEEEQLWADQYDEALDDMFSIQKFIATEIASALKSEIMEEGEDVSSLGTDNYEAYDMYLMGNEYYHRFTLEDNLSALELFQKSLVLDPDFTLAKAGMSNAFCQMAQRSNYPDVWLDSAYRYAIEVTAEAPELSEGYRSIGLYYSLKGDYKKAIELYKQAVEIDDNVYAVINLSKIYYQAGNLVDALAVLSKASSNNHINYEFWYNHAAVYYRLNDLERSVFYLEKALSIDPNHVPSLMLEWIIAFMNREDWEVFQTANRLGLIGGDNIDIALNNIVQVLMSDDPDWDTGAKEILNAFDGREADYIDMPYVYNFTGYIYMKGGMEERAREMFDLKMEKNLERTEKGDLNYRNYYEISQALAASGRADECMQWLERAINAGWTEIEFGKFDPIMDLENRNGSPILQDRVLEKLDSMRNLLKNIDQQFAM